MDSMAGVLELGSALRELIRGRGLTGRAVALQLGYNAGQFSRAVHGVRPLKVADVFRILQALDTPAFSFFTLIYPLGGEPVALARKPPRRSLEPPGSLSFEDFGAAVEEQLGGPPSPEEATDKTRLLLKECIRRSELSQRAVSRAMGLSDDSLAEVLRGKATLTFRHLFGVLVAIGMSPARFFAELFDDEATTPLEKMAQARYYDALEKVLRKAGEEALKKRLEQWTKASPASPVEAPTQPPVRGTKGDPA